MATLSAQLQNLQTEINELLGIASLQTASNIETEVLMRELEKNVSDLKAAVYKHLYRAYGHSNTRAPVVASEKKEEVKKRSKGFRLPGFGKK